MKSETKGAHSRSTRLAGRDQGFPESCDLKKKNLMEQCRMQNYLWQLLAFKKKAQFDYSREAFKSL